LGLLSIGSQTRSNRDAKTGVCSKSGTCHGELKESVLCTRLDATNPLVYPNVLTIFGASIMFQQTHWDPLVTQSVSIGSADYCQVQTMIHHSSQIIIVSTWIIYQIDGSRNYSITKKTKTTNPSNCCWVHCNIIVMNTQK
jgi:hypothetical protein